MTAGTPVTPVSFYFDPGCPWTWATSRWLVEIAGRESLDVTWRAFELARGRPLNELPEQFRDSAGISRRFLRIVEAAHSDGQAALIGALYAALGSRQHDAGRPAGPELMDEAVDEVGLTPKLRAAADDPSWDAAVAQARAEALTLAGDDVGSPVLTLDRPGVPRVGFFGPVLHPTPTGDAAARLWDLVVAAADIPALFELKRRRTSHP